MFKRASSIASRFGPGSPAPRTPGVLALVRDLRVVLSAVAMVSNKKIPT